MKEKIALFGFNGEAMCFVHVLLNALDMNERGREVRIVAEGASVKALVEVARKDHAFHGLYVKAREAGLFDGACKACSAKMGALEAVKELNMPLLDDMSGHPSMDGYMERGYRIVTF
jgi:hypothetical protein